MPLTIRVHEELSPNDRKKQVIGRIDDRIRQLNHFMPDFSREVQISVRAQLDFLESLRVQINDNL